jgi:hypothetical protein
MTGDITGMTEKNRGGLGRNGPRERGKIEEWGRKGGVGRRFLRRRAPGKK